MQVQIIEDQLERTMSILQPGNLPNENSYPQVTLSLTDQAQSLTIPTLKIDNGLVSVLIAPTLGGRILNITDLRSGTSLFSHSQEMLCEKDNFLGVTLSNGLTLNLHPRRLTQMGLTDFEIHDPDSADSPGAIFTHEFVAGRSVSWTQCITLHPNSSIITLDLKLINRSLETIELGATYNLFSESDLDRMGRDCYYSKQKDSGIAFKIVEGWASHQLESKNQISFGTPGGKVLLGARKSLEYKIQIVPFGAMNGCSLANSQLALNLSNHKLNLLPSEKISGKMFLQSNTGQTFESPADLSPEKMTKVDLSTLPDNIIAFQIRDNDKNQILEFNSQEKLITREEPIRLPIGQNNEAYSEVHARFLGTETISPSPYTTLPGYESSAWLMESILLLEENKKSEADEKIDKALTFNADDALAWWYKAHIQRKRGLDEEASQSLSNAYMLSPMEQILVVESFFSQSEPTAEPNPLLKKIARNPEAVNEIAHQLLAHRLQKEFYEFADEILRHQEQPLLRLLLADQLLQRTTMHAEAGDHVNQATKSHWMPPFPNRFFEVLAVKNLLKRFPDNEILQILNDCLKFRK